MKLIDADAIRIVSEKYDEHLRILQKEKVPKTEIGILLDCLDCKRMIECASTVDAVPVIRCKDCIHRYSICPMITIYPDGSISFRAQDDWFCFMGERKEE